MKKIKLLALLAAVILCLQSCGIIIINDIHGKDTESVTEDESGRETETKEVKEIIIDKQTSDEMKKKADETLEGLDTQKYTGMRILVAVTDTLFYEGDGSLTPLTSDRVIRADKIEQKLGATVSVVGFSEDELFDKLKSSGRKKEYFADVIAVPISMVGKLCAEEVIISLRTVPGLDLEAGYFDTDSLSAFSCGHNTYAVSGDGCFEPEKTYCVYFNKDMAKQLGYDLHSLVSDGKWTLEKYAECVSAAVSAGSTSVVMKNAEKYKKMLITGSGFDFTDTDIDKTPSANTFTDEYGKKTELLSALPQASQPAEPMIDFLSGGSLFYIDTLLAAEKMADSPLVWGMLPMPKYNEEYEYGAYISEDAVVLCVPNYAADNRMSGDFIEAFCAASSEYIKYDFLYHNMLDVLRDNGSVNSLNIVMNNPNYDFVFAMKGGYPNLYANTAGAFDEMISGTLTFDVYKQREEDVAAYMEKWFPVTHR